MYKANLSLRTALKILKPYFFFKATNEQALYKGIWCKLVKIHQCQSNFCDWRYRSDNFNHSEFVSQKCKDAIVDQFRERTGQRPSIDKVHPDLRINIHIDKDQVSVALLQEIHCINVGIGPQLILPINEVLQQVFGFGLGRTRWLDPMCGSGTFWLKQLWLLVIFGKH
jgi:putative N6-adenine-specific DNA methylase